MIFCLAIPVSHDFLVYSSPGSQCARHNFSYTRGWMQMVFYCQMIYSPETDRHSKTWFTITAVWNIVDKCTYYTQDTYSVHKAGFLLCRAHPPSFLACCMSNLLHCLMPTAVSLPFWRARSPALPHIQYGPVSPRVHALLYPTVRYSQDSPMYSSVLTMDTF